ncbi:hypothetical protein B0H19DRAFT_1277758 [Mycena capillaripes]|nr:hypothetical protein B0H19DRAFT_1277758 [Mycena capillaripes]
MRALNPLTYPVVSDDIECPSGYSPTSVHNTYTYNGALKEFTDIAGSFFHVQWYTFNTTGTDNVLGATRAGWFGGTPFNETLTAYDTRPDALLFTIHGNLPLALEAFISGKATYIDVLTYLCSDDQTAAYDLFYNIHTTGFQNLAAIIGMTVLAGDCPT